MGAYNFYPFFDNILMNLPHGSGIVSVFDFEEISLNPIGRSNVEKLRAFALFRIRAEYDFILGPLGFPGMPMQLALGTAVEV